MAEKVEAKGGQGGNVWDDGFDYDGVTKIHVRGGRENIQFIKVDYVKAGQTKAGPIHGVSSRGFTQTFEINHLENEYLVAVEGYYNETTGVIQALQFKTNIKTSGMMGYDEASGTKFWIWYHMKKIVGFHGFAEKNLNSLGAHFIRIPAIKSGIQGNQNSGLGFDRGGNYDGIRKVYVVTDGFTIRHIKIDYEKHGQVKSHEHGEFNGTQQEFEIKYPYEYITSVEGTYNHTMAYQCVVLTSLTFKTSKGRTSPTIGEVIGTNFVHKSQGNVITGFHGRVGSCVDGIGVYYVPMPAFPPPEKLQAKGGLGGDAWDDGSFRNVKKIFVGQGTGWVVKGNSYIAFLRFEYENETSAVVVGDHHGRQTNRGTEEFGIDYPREYLTSVEGCSDNTYGVDTFLTMLKFKTNKGTSKSFGIETDTKFVLEKQGYKIVGFHGEARDVINKIGVHVVPIDQ